MFFTVLGAATFIFFILFSVVFVWFMFRADADLTLLAAEKFGKKIDFLKRKVIWITGASSGIGEHLAYELASYGCKLVLSGTNKDALINVRNQCLENCQLTEDDVLLLPFDISDCTIHEECVKKVLAHFKQIDILVNNAGRSQRAQFQDIEDEVDRAMFGINVFGPVNLTRKVLKHFLDVGKGHVVVTSSTAGKLGAPNSATYTGSKHALHGYFESLRSETIRSGIDVTLVCPGPVFSRIVERAFTESANRVYNVKTSPSEKRMATSRCSYLMAVSIANKLDEVWISQQPILLAHYLAQYTPTLFRTFMMRFISKEQVKALREGSH